MTIKNILPFFLSVIACLPNMAQKKKNNTPPPADQPTTAQQLYQDMLPSTAKVMFIDSIIVDKDNFLSSIPLPPQAGTLSHTLDMYAYENEFHNQRFFAYINYQGTGLFHSFTENDQWTDPQRLPGIPPEYQDANYPFMMSDGVTLYFAAKGPESIGGYDIFNTFYDTTSKRFYKPQNLGLPFNSKANDYMYVVSEPDSLAWLVTDRFQPQDKVCIYIFIPTPTRLTYSDSTSNEKLLQLASLNSISDTWFDDNTRQQALERLQVLLNGGSAAKQAQNKIFFIVNDQITYTSLDDFKTPESQQAWQDIQEQTSQLQADEKRLQQMRDQFTGQPQLRQDILKLEQQTLHQRLQISQLTKQLRNALNQTHKLTN